MKKYSLPALLILSLFGLLAFANQRPAADKRTEEYAVVSVIQVGKTNYISVTVGSQTTTEKEFQSEKGLKRYDLAPVIGELEKLNAQGFELVSGSNAAQVSYPFYTFTMKRKIN